MPNLVFSKRQCELALEAFQCLRSGRLEAENHHDAAELARMTEYVQGLASHESLPRPAPSPGRMIPGEGDDVPVTRPAPTYLTPEGKPFQAGALMAAGQRRCSDPGHGNRWTYLSSIDWDTSNRIYGQPLCQAHMAARRRS